jgi:polyisoprenyl-phosphate glycosyltransferase
MSHAVVDLAAIVPCHNEAENVERTYTEIKRELARYGEPELLFVDDGSTDSTLDRIKRLAATDPNVKYLSLSRNYGQEAAFSAGFRYSKATWTVQFDADLQSPASEVHKLVAKALEGYDAVFSYRPRRRDPLHRRLGSDLLNWVAARLGIELPQGAWGFRMVRTSVARRVVDLHLASPYFLATVPLLTARWVRVPVAHRERTGGPAKWTFRKLALHAVDLFTGFSFRALVPVYLLAAATVVGALVLAVLAATGRVAPDTVGVAVLAVQGAMFLGLAVVARYLVRVVKGQARPPLYLVREANLPLDPADDLYRGERAMVPVGPGRGP